MSKVIVAGGGVAGVAAATASARSGARVVLLESSSRLATDRALLPYLLSGRRSPDDLLRRDPAGLFGGLAIEVRCGERVRRVDPDGRSLQTAGPGGARHRFDALVLATGASYVPDQVRGAAKRGVFSLRELEDYSALAESLQRISRLAVVAPYAPLALVAAQEASRRTRVSVFLPAGTLGRFSAGLARRLAAGAASSGVEVVETGVQSIVGVKQVEAVISRGRVHACDAVAILPGGVPSLPQTPCRLGIHGGVVVDQCMRTSLGGVLAAGECSELRTGTGSIQFRLHSTSVAMGRAAGRNAAGGVPVEAGISGCFTLDVFGVEACVAGLDVHEAKSVGLGLTKMEDDTADGPCLSMTFDSRSRRVYGVQAAGAGALSLSGSISEIVSSHSTLEELAFGESPYLPLSNADASPLCLTAGKFLAELSGQPR